MRFQRLSDWLAWQETLHPKTIDLGLERCASVAERMGLTQFLFPVITVAGTNGKGSCVAMLEAILAAAGYRVGAYTSPHLVRYNERVRVQSEEASDCALICAFDAIDRARGTTSLTYFEFGTLAAMDIFRRREVDVAVLEVGLGGRLDAVNLFDPVAALVTTVDIDHVSWLGDNREAIGREKAGIFRRARPAVCGDPQPPASLKAHAQEVGCPLYCLHDDFSFSVDQASWKWNAGPTTLSGLPKLPLSGGFQYQNAAAVIMVLQLLEQNGLHVGTTAVRQGLHQVKIRGRFEVLGGPGERILDVAHNVQAAHCLVDSLRHRACAGHTLAVFSIMADKDVYGVLAAMAGLVDAWYVAPLREARSASAELIRDTITALNGQCPISIFPSVAEAYVAALGRAGEQDRIVVFGSFYAVGEVLSYDNELVGARDGQ